ncbi:MAG: TrbG/VirB9 family P-type conjugative transfer protein [Alphaproteobacteria bacterium]
MKKIIGVLAVASMMTSNPVLALDDDYLFPTDSRIKMLPYDESDIYTITTKYGYQTSIVFDPHEEIYTISMGDRSLWQIIPSGNRLFIRPMDVDVITNMTIITSKRSYNFDLKSVEEESPNSSIIYVAKFVYPEDMPQAMMSPYDSQLGDLYGEVPLEAPAEIAAEMPTQPATETTAPVTAAPYVPPMPIQPAAVALSGVENTRYTYAGPDELAPLQVYDNGKSTYFKYRDITQPLPNAYIIDSDGQENPVGHYVKDGMMVVDNVAGEWLLKSSAGDVMIYNEMLNPK